MSLPALFPDCSPYLTAINEAAEAYKTTPTEQTRLHLKQASLALNRSLETIPEATFRVNFAPITPVCVRVAVEDEWLDRIVKAPGGSITADELSQQVKAEKGLVTRLIRVLIAEDLVKEVGFETYAALPVTMAFVVPGLKHAHMHAIDNVMPSLSGLPQYLKNLSYKEPQDDTFGPYVVAHGKKFFTQLQYEPDKRKTFDLFMSAQKQGRGGAGGWLDVFPMQERMIVSKTAETSQLSSLQPATQQIIMVDIGGGIGHELTEFRTRFPESDHPGRVILQDLPEVVDSVDARTLVGQGIEFMAHDFFTEQPVKGAQFYYLSSIIHDWSTTDASRILSSITPAMTLNHSSVIVVDLVVPEENVPWWPAMVDITLLAIMCGRQRTRRELAGVAAKAGLRVRKNGVHMLPTGEGATEMVLLGDERE